MYFALVRNFNLLKEKFIPGIYNYCDRWCERCTFTSRCRNYENTGNLSPEQTEISNRAFWENISSGLEDAIKLLHQAAEKQGFNLEMSAEHEAVCQQQDLLLRTACEQHSLSNLCKQYRKIAQPVTENSVGFTDKTRELAAHLQLGISTEQEAVDTVSKIGDCLDIIKWYLLFIDAKLQRALHGKLKTGEPEDENYQNDYNGSAKIALIAMEKSMGGWSQLYRLMPSSEDVTLYALALLEQLTKKTMEEFPGTSKFIRPGFDD